MHLKDFACLESQVLPIKSIVELQIFFNLNNDLI